MPKYRGAAPIYHTLLNNDKETLNRFIVEKNKNLADLTAEINSILEAKKKTEEVLNKKIDNLQSDISDIKTQLNNVENNCNRMDGHISFVENTYDTLRHPINIFKAKIEQVFGKGQDKESKMLN